MGLFTAGQVVIVRFPFSDLTSSKMRPAVVLADVGKDDWILCQITSQPYGDPRAIKLESWDFTHGSLRVTSFVRPGKLFTAHSSLVTGKIGELKPGKFTDIQQTVKRIIG